MLHLLMLSLGFGSPVAAPATGVRLHVPASIAGRDARSPEARGIAADVAQARGLRDLGSLDRKAQIPVGLLLKITHKEELEQLTLLQGDRRSPLYHHYLSSAQFNRYFSPSPTAYARVLATLQRHGFRITQTYRDRTFVTAAAPVSDVERYFGTRIHAMMQPGVGVRYGNITQAMMPDDLRNVAVSVSGLHSIQTAHFPLHFADKNAVRASTAYALALHAMASTRTSASGKSQTRRPFNVPTPLASSTPSAAQPGPDPTIAPGTPTSDFVNSVGGYGPEIYADAYDYPVQHGYGGTNHPIGNIIEADFLRTDIAKEESTYGIKRTGQVYTYCGSAGGGSDCFGAEGHGDPVGEATLDANIMTSLAPNADYYVYLAPLFDDIQIESAYVMAVDQNIVEALNSSFGSCETDDPSFGYATNYIAMEGAALGITFEASTGDTGATTCGLYVTNGAPQTEINVSIPSSNYYFTALGGTNFMPVTSCSLGSCYTLETVWTHSNGGSSVYEPIPAWQLPAAQAQTVALETSTTYRNTPDMVFTANAPPFDTGVGFAIFDNGSAEAGGGTSVASPMWTAMQGTINQVQNSRNGWVNPGLYAAFMQFGSFAFHEIIGGTNGYYAAVPGYNDAVGMGSPLGWELAGVENGTAGFPSRPNPTPAPQPTVTASPAGPTPSPTPLVVPSPVGTSFNVTTVAGNGTGASLDGTGTAAEFASPTGITYTATGQGADATLFIADTGTGFLRGLDLTTGKVTTYDNKTYTISNHLYGLGISPFASGLPNAGLYVADSADGHYGLYTLPTTVNPTPAVRSAGANTSAIVFDTAGNFYSASTSTGTITYTVVVPTSGTGEPETAASGLPSTGTYGMTADGSTPANLIITNSTTNAIFESTEDLVASTISAYTSGAPLKAPKEIVYVAGVSAFFVANCGGNNIVRVDSSTKAMTIVAGDGAARETNGYNTGAEFNCPFGITTDATNLYVTDLGGNTVRKISGLK